MVTRAQTQKDPKKEESKAPETTQKKSCKQTTRRGRPKKARKKSKSSLEPNTKGEEGEELTAKERRKEPIKQAKSMTFLPSYKKGGIVPIDKKYEPLEAAI